MSKASWAEPARESRRTFSLPKLGGHEWVRELVHAYGGIDVVSRDFHVDVDLVNRYLVGQIEAPYTFLVALWWHTSHGFAQGFEEAHWTHTYNSFRVRQAETKVRYLETVIEHAVALLERRADAASLVRESLALARSSAERSSGDPLAGIGSSI